MRRFSTECKAIPPILEEGDNYIIYPYYEDILRLGKRNPVIIPKKIAKAAMDLLRFFYDRGYALIDFHPKNVIYDKRNGIKFIDFEYLYKYKITPDSFDQSYDIAGIPDDFDGDRVPGASPDITWEKFWKPHIKTPGQQLKMKIKKLLSAVNKISKLFMKEFAKILFKIFYSSYLEKKLRYFEEKNNKTGSYVD
jgi:hypothetical protein